MAEEQKQNSGQTVSVPINVGLLVGMLDFGFTRFIALRVIKVLYILMLILIPLLNLLAIVIAFSANALVGVAMLIILPIIMVLEIIILRVGLELYVTIFRIGENTAKIAAARSA